MIHEGRIAMADPKCCAVCGDIIRDKGRTYCAECRAWVKDVDSSRHNCKPGERAAPKRYARAEDET